MLEIKRILSLQPTKNPLKGSSALFLWGPRKVGKTTFLTQQFPQAKRYDLLNSKIRSRFQLNPHLFREEVLADHAEVIIIDEIQKVPELLDEVHWLLENHAASFVLCGSSARKIKDYATNMLGGRAKRYLLFPFVTQELDEPFLNIELILNRGLIPGHLFHDDYLDFLESYIADYLEEEIAKEARIRNLSNFSRFLRVVGLTHGQLLNYSKIAGECGVSANTVREYFHILKDSFLGFELVPWTKRKERRLIETSRFFLFDVGVANFLRGVQPVVFGTDVFGFAFEHFLLLEVRAYLSYMKKRHELSFYRTASGIEVDLIVGDMLVAIECKSTKRIDKEHLKGLRALSEEFSPKRKMVVSLDETPRKTEEGIEILPWKMFCKDLWEGLIV